MECDDKSEVPQARRHILCPLDYGVIRKLTLANQKGEIRLLWFASNYWLRHTPSVRSQAALALSDLVSLHTL